MMGVPKTDLSGSGPEEEAARLSRVIGVDDSEPEKWSDADLCAMLRHQLAAPLAFEFGAKYRRALRMPNHPPAGGITTFRDLFDHPTPPLWLLQMAKEFFKKQAGGDSDRRPEQKVCYLLYLESILIAKLRAGASITKMSDDDLVRGIEWVAAQTWVENQTLSVFVNFRASSDPKLLRRNDH